MLLYNCILHKEKCTDNNIAEDERMKRKTNLCLKSVNKRRNAINYEKKKKDEKKRRNHEGTKQTENDYSM